LTSRGVALGRLVRLSLAPSALADALCGLALGGVFGRGVLVQGDWPALLVAPFASLCLFHGGMALNDWADRHEDAACDVVARRNRPLPSGAIAPTLALVLGLGLIAVAVAAAASVGRAPALLAAALAIAVLGYDFVGRGPLLGPLLLAQCRALDVLLAAAIGAEVAGRALDPSVSVPALAYGAYVFAIGRLGRLEDDTARAPGMRPRRLVAQAAALLVVVPLAAAAYEPSMWLALGAALALAGAVAPARLAARRDAWSHADVVRAMGVLLRRLVVATAAATCAVGEPVVGLALLALFPLGVALRRVFPPS